MIVLDNDGYTTERLIIDGGFNDIQQWNFSSLPEVIQSGPVLAGPDPRASSRTH